MVKTKMKTSQHQQVKRVVKKETSVDTHSYKGWLNSDSFLKRAFAAWGYMMVAGLIIQIPLIILFGMIMMIIMISVGVTTGTGSL